MPRPASFAAVLCTLGTVAALGCDSSPDGRGLSLAPTAPVLAVGDRNESYGIALGKVNVCAFFPEIDPPAPRTAGFVASAPAGENVIAGPFSITPYPSCIEIWNYTAGTAVDVAASLTGLEAGYKLDRVVTFVGNGVDASTVQDIYGSASGSVRVSGLVGAYIWFKFDFADLPPSGGQGCTPGYWRQSQHFGAWTAPYLPSTPFSSVFADAFPGKTLHDVVWLGGGGLNALGRMSVAALLNAASADVNYDLSTQAVINSFNAAYSSGAKRTIEDQKNVFDFLNNQGCPL